MELRHLRCFVAVAHTRNLSRAAAHLRVAQPALSRQMRDLERELGVQLLDRRAKGTIPTLAGEAFARGAAEVLAATAAALDRAEGTARGRRGRVVAGAARAVIVRGLTAALEEAVRRDHPEVVLVVHDADPPHSWEQVRDGEADLAISGDAPRDRQVVAEPLWTETVDRAIVPADHPLAQRASLTVPDLGTLPLVFAPRSLPSPEFFDQALANLRARGLRSPLLALDGDLRAAHLAVAAGRGWTLISRALAAAPPQGTAVVPVEGTPIRMLVAVAWRRGERRAVVRTVVDAIIAIARQYPEQCLRPAPALPPAAPARPPRRRPGGAIPLGLDLRHLRALLGVAATQTIGRAAERLGVTQPALSRQLRELEHTLGFPLLERSARGVTLTPAGAALAGACPEVFLAVERLVAETSRAKRGMEGRCVVGAVATVATGELLTAVLSCSAELHPHVQIVIDEMATPRQVPALTKGEIDLGLAHAYPGLDESDARGVVRARIQEDRLDCALVSRTHPLGRRASLAAADLAGVPLLFMERTFHPPFYDRVMSALGALGLTPRVDATYDGLQVVWALAAQGKGWCIGFRSQRRRPPAGTAAVPIEGLDLAWGIDLVRRGDERNPAVLAVAELFTASARARSATRHRAPPRSTA